jgi:hypothetical protein
MSLAFGAIQLACAKNAEASLEPRSVSHVPLSRRTCSFRRGRAPAESNRPTVLSTVFGGPLPAHQIAVSSGRLGVAARETIRFG